MSVTGSFYGRDRFDPVLILAQIVLLQACFYTSYLLLLVFFNRATGTTASVTDQVFDHTQITLKHFPGWVTSSALLLSASGPTALAFVALVGRAKRAADFACTLLVSHIFATAIHSGFPNSLVWWTLHIVATVALAVVAEFVSLRLELRDISVPRPNGAAAASASNSASGPGDRDRDRADRDRDRGRDRDLDRDLERGLQLDRGRDRDRATERSDGVRGREHAAKRELDIEAQLEDADRTRSHAADIDVKPLVAPT